MTRLLIENIGLLVTGPGDAAPLRDTALAIEDGVVIGVGTDLQAPDQVIDAAGLTVFPGLVDGHVHPTFGEWTPAQDAIGWFSNYLHGGTTRMVSAGELHVPGLAFDELDPRTVLNLALTSKATTGRLRPSGVKVHCGTVLLVPGLQEGHFDDMADAGLEVVKFIFYNWDQAPDGEAQRYVRWARERGIKVKIHSGGVSRSGSSRIAGYDVVTAADPDVVAHISGGPIPMPDEEMRAVCDSLPQAAIEVCASMNYRATTVVVRHLRDRGQLHRLVLGTDTPGGTGVIPRGMLRTIMFVAAVCDVDPVAALAAGTANVAAAHGVPGGVIAEGEPADLVLLGPIRGSQAADGLESLAVGDLPGISMVLVDGLPLVAPRSQQTPPPQQLARVVHG